MMSNPLPGVDEIECGPIFVVKSAPDRVIAIDRDRILDLHLLRSPANVVEIFFEIELRRMDADHDHSVILVFLCPRANVRKGPQPINAGVSPELDEDYPSAQASGRQW